MAGRSDGTDSLALQDASVFVELCRESVWSTLPRGPHGLGSHQRDHYLTRVSKVSRAFGPSGVEKTVVRNRAGGVGPLELLLESGEGKVARGEVLTRSREVYRRPFLGARRAGAEDRR